MTRPDEIAALADTIKRYRNMGDQQVYSGEMVANILEHWKGRLSATAPGDTVRAIEAIEWQDVEEDDPDVIVAAHAIAEHGVGRPWDDFEPVSAYDLGQSDLIEYARAAVAALRAKAALAPAEKAGDELKVACASCKKIPGPHCQRPTCAFRDYIDTRTVKTVLAMTPSELSVIPASAVESGREMVRQAVAVTPTPPSADVVKIQPAIDALTNGQEQADAHGTMVRVSRQALDEVLAFIQSAAQGGGTKGGES